MKKLHLNFLKKITFALLCLSISCSEASAQQDDAIKINYDSLTINYDKIYALALFNDIKGALNILDTSSVKTNADKVFKNEYENRFKYSYDKSNHFSKTDTILNPLRMIFQDYWRKSLLNSSSDAIYEKDFLQNLLAFLINENSKAKFTNHEISLNNIKEVFKWYVKSKGYHTRVLRKSETKYDLLVWKTETDTSYIIPVIDGAVKVNCRFLENIVAIGWNGYATLGRIDIGGWAIGDSIWCVKKHHDLNSESFIINFLSHEGQHIMDYKLFPGMSMTDLEYRGKLAELYFAKNTLYNSISYFINHAKTDNTISDHHFASYKLVRDMSKLLFNKEIENDMQKWKSISIDKINSAAKQLYFKSNEKLKNEINIGATFCLKSNKSFICGHNNDFVINKGFVTVNRRGIEKTAYNAPPSIPTKWISKYGSITLNQIEIDMPMEGMNEKGLVIIQSQLVESIYPDRENKPSVNSYQWIQYQLDNSASLDDVIKNTKKLNIETADMWRLHFFICDSSGNVGIIELLNGQVIVHKGANVVHTVLFNDAYKHSMDNLKEYTGFGGQRPIPEKWNTIRDMTAKVCSMIKNYSPKKSNIIDYGFNILNEVRISGRTQWSVIYDISTKRIIFNSSQNKRKRIMSMNDFSFSCQNPIKLLDIHTYDSKKNITGQFFDFSVGYYRNYQKNLHKFLKDNVPEFPGVPTDIFEFIVNYPLICNCKEK